MFIIVEKCFVISSEITNLIQKEQDCDKDWTIFLFTQMFGYNKSLNVDKVSDNYVHNLWSRSIVMDDVDLVG